MIVIDYHGLSLIIVDYLALLELLELLKLLELGLGLGLYPSCN